NLIQRLSGFEPECQDALSQFFINEPPAVPLFAGLARLRGATDWPAFFIGRGFCIHAGSWKRCDNESSSRSGAARRLIEKTDRARENPNQMSVQCVHNCIHNN